MASTILSIWAEQIYKSSRAMDPDFETPEQRDPTFNEISAKLISLMERGPPPTYAEMGTLLKRIQADCQALLNAFKEIGRVSKDRIPELPKQINPLKTTADFFSLNTAHTAVTTHFNALSKLLPKGSAKTTLPQIQEKQRKVLASIGRYSVMKERYDVQVSSGVAGALVSMKVMPPKIGPIVKAIMESIKVSNLSCRPRAAAQLPEPG
jgi:TATA-binding protein-associated factor